MKIVTQRVLLQTILILAFCIPTAQSRECKGANFADQIQVDGSTLTLNGLGLRLATVFSVKVYVAGLYVAKASTDPNTLLAATAPSELILHFVRSVDEGDLRKGWSEGFEKNAKDRLPALKERIAILNGWMPPLKTGDRLTFIHEPGVGIQVDVNGAMKGTIKGDDFAKAFLSIWLGASPPNPEVKAGLLGGPCG